MALLGLCSAAGSPGVTTAAVGLCLTWNRSAMLVDADPGAHQAVLAGYLRGQVRTGKGLQRVAEAHRDRRPLAEVVHDQTVCLTDQGVHERRLLPGFARPANAALFTPVWPSLVETFLGYESVGIDVIVDLGRMNHDGVPRSLLQQSDLVALVIRSSLRSIAAARNYAGVLSEQAGFAAGDRNVGLILLGENKPYGRREIAKTLNLPVITAIADDPHSASVLSEGARRPHKFDQAPLAKSLQHAGGELRRWIRTRRERLGLSDVARLWDAEEGWTGDRQRRVPGKSDVVPAAAASNGWAGRS